MYDGNPGQIDRFWFELARGSSYRESTVLISSNFWAYFDLHSDVTWRHISQFIVRIQFSLKYTLSEKLLMNSKVFDKIR